MRISDWSSDVCSSDLQTAHELASQLSTYIAENAKTARAFLKFIGTTRPLQEITIHTLTDKVDGQQIKTWLQPLLDGGEIGLVSAAGSHAVAEDRTSTRLKSSH